MTKSNQIDMANGPILSKVFLFSLPLALSNILQLLFNAADIIVVGKFAGSLALAAVGATSSLVNLLVSVFLGISVGVNILVARYLGSRQDERVRDAVHTAIVLGIILGSLLLIVGQVLCAPMLRMMDTPEDIFDLSLLYLRIFFCGAPAALTYNFGAAILRAMGDTRRPLLYLAISGVVNVALNLLLVIVFHLDVAGVAIATTVSQCLNLFLVIRCLCRLDGPCRLDLKALRMRRNEASGMLLIGLPAGLQSVVINYSNVMIQSTVNSFGSAVVAAHSAASSLSNFTYSSMNAVSQAAVSFTSQNLGAGKLDRIRKVLLSCLLTVCVLGVAVSGVTCLLGEQLLGVYIDSSDPNYTQVLQYGMVYLLRIVAPYTLCGIMEVLCFMVRGLGKSWTPMIVAMLGMCGLRLLWIEFVFPLQPTLGCLYASYLVSWILTGLTHLLCYCIYFRKIRTKRSSATARL